LISIKKLLKTLTWVVDNDVIFCVNFCGRNDNNFLKTPFSVDNFEVIENPSTELSTGCWCI
jgi:hypothetical protein